MGITTFVNLMQTSRLIQYRLIAGHIAESTTSEPAVVDGTFSRCSQGAVMHYPIGVCLMVRSGKGGWADNIIYNSAIYPPRNWCHPSKALL